MTASARTDRSGSPRVGSTDDQRKGLAATEVAVCLPVIVLITFAAIEASNGIYLKQILTQASYEAARVVTAHGGTTLEATTRANQVLAARQIQGASISVTPVVSGATPSGTEITVTITAPANANAIGPKWYFKDQTFRAKVVMVRN